MMSFWIKISPHRVYFIMVCNLIVYLNACSNESTTNEQWNISDNNTLLRKHYDKIFNLIEKLISGQKISRLEDEKLPITIRKIISRQIIFRLEEENLPIQIFGCIPGYEMIIATFPFHKRSNISGAHRVCSDEINAAAIIDFKNTHSRLIQLNKMLKTIIKDDEYLAHNFKTPGLRVGIFLIDDCNDESFARYLIQNAYDLSRKNNLDVRSHLQHLRYRPGASCKGSKITEAPCIGYAGSSFTSFPIRSFNSTFNIYTPKRRNVWKEISYSITERRLQNFSFETFKDSYIVCSILRHFRFTQIVLVYDTEFNGDRFVEMARFFNICVEKLSLWKVNDNATNLEQHKEFFEKLRKTYFSLLTHGSTWRTKSVFVIFCNRPRVFQELIRKITDIRKGVKKIFITGGDSLPQGIDLTRMFRDTKSRLFVFHKEENEVENDPTYDRKLKLMEEDLMKDETFNFTYEEYWSKELECNFPENEFAFVQKNQSNDKENGSEFPDFQVSSNVKCRRNFLSKLDELFYAYTYLICGIGAYMGEASCLNITEELRIQLIADNSWLTSTYSIKLNIHPGNTPIGNGTWDAPQRRILFQTLPNVTEYFEEFGSKCSTLTSCKFGQREKLTSVNDFCCMECGEDCESDQILIWNECKTCKSAEEWPNENRTVCVKKKIRSLQWNDLEILICVTYSTIIILMVTTTLWIFIKNRNTPVVKASTRELSFIMLVAMIAVESTVFIFMSKPEMPFCSTIHMVSLLSFGTIYAGLLVRTVRIARLLAMSKREFPKLKMKFMSSKSQVVITVILIIIQSILAVMMLCNTESLPSKIRDIDPQEGVAPTITRVCQYNLSTFTGNFSFIFVLIALCTGCAVWVRKVPDNFNEAKYIGFCMYTTCVTWIAFGYTLCAKHNYEILALCTCFSTNNLMALIFLFSPKLYIIIFKPEKNRRRYFNTLAKNIRVHKRDSRETVIPLKNLKDIDKKN